jgi:hypothetical protein
VRGTSRVVVGSDEGGCSGCYRSERGIGRQRAHACEAATIAAAIYPGRKMSRWGLRVSERGWLGGPAGRLRPSGGAGKVAQREGRGEQARRG